MTLTLHPGGRIRVPLVASVAKLAERRLDVVPTALVLEPPPDQFGDERAPPAWAHPAIELRHEIVIERYVHTHGLNLAHNRAAADAGKGERARAVGGPPPVLKARAERAPAVPARVMASRRP